MGPNLKVSRGVRMSSVDGLNGGSVSSRENNEIRLGLVAVRYILTLCSDLERIYNES